MNAKGRTSGVRKQTRRTPAGSIRYFDIGPRTIANGVDEAHIPMYD
jgi:hypothetical protein